jgi:hypothetical protein
VVGPGDEEPEPVGLRALEGDADEGRVNGEVVPPPSPPQATAASPIRAATATVVRNLID